MTNESACALCLQDGGEVVHRVAHMRIVLVEDSLYPGFCRVIWNAHASEMTDLSASDRADLMEAVWLVEAAVRDAMRPDKINIASLGNVVPHLHWHVIPRYRDDAHFPGPIWAQQIREASAAILAERRALLPELRAAIVRHFDKQGQHYLSKPCFWMRAHAVKETAMAQFTQTNRITVPTELTVHQQSRTLEVAIEDGARFLLPFEFLRVKSHSAEMHGLGLGLV